MSNDHQGECWGGHDFTVTCEEATAIREEEQRKLYACPTSPTSVHSFSGGTSCDYCGKYLQEMFPDEGIGEES